MSNDPSFDDAKRLYLEQYGDPMVTNTYLKIALVLLALVALSFHNHSPLTFEKLKGDPDNIEKHFVSYIKGFSANVRTIFEYFEFETEIEKMREANILYLVVSKFCDVNLHPDLVPNEEMGLIFENLIRRFNELANETAGDHFTPREVIRLMVHTLRHGFKCYGRTLRVAYFKAAHELNPELEAQYRANCVS